MESAREARRRKILERGSERLAFIAGQSQSLNPSSPFSSPRPPTLQPEQHQEQENPRSTTDDLHHVDAAGVEAHKHQPIDQTFNTEVEDDKELLPEHDADDQELLPEHDADRELSRHESRSEFAKCKMGKRFQGGMRKEAAANEEQDGRILEPSTGPIAQILSDQMVDRTPYANSPMIHQVLTSKQISRAISASENIRLLCAVGIALLVVMSTHGLGSRVLGTIPNFRPLYLVLLTDTTVIIGHLFVSRKSCSKDGEEERSKDGEEERRTRQEEFGLAHSIGSALEIGLVFQKALNAAFMDCSICAVIMISGLLV